MTNIEHPWDVGPSELIAFAIENMHGGTDFNRRLSFLVLDIGVETLFKTYLALPSNITKAKLSHYKRTEAASGSFNDLLNGVRDATPLKIDPINLDYVMYYHGIRNTLYHQGSTVGTVREDQLKGYAKLAVELLKDFLGVDLSSMLIAPVVNPEPEEELISKTEAFHHLLTRIRIPDGQLALYKALYEAGDEGLTLQGLEIMTDRTPSVMAGVLGALGNRIKNTPGFESSPDINAVFEISRDEDNGWLYRMKPSLREAIEREEVFEKYGIRISSMKRGASNKISPRNQLYLEFFSELSSKYSDITNKVEFPKPLPQSWFSFGGGKTGFAFGWAFKSKRKFSAEIYIDASNDPGRNIEYLHLLKASVDPTDDDLEELIWEELPKARACRIAFYREGDIKELNNNLPLRNEVISWGVSKMIILENSFREFISNL